MTTDTDHVCIDCHLSELLNDCEVEHLGDVVVDSGQKVIGDYGEIHVEAPNVMDDGIQPVYQRSGGVR